MTILAFLKLFPGYTFHLVFSHLNEAAYEIYSICGDVDDEAFEDVLEA